MGKIVDLVTPEANALARSIYLAWMNDERWQRMDLATVAKGRPLAFFWADIAAKAVLAYEQTGGKTNG
jgi:hypothetical protein